MSQTETLLLVVLGFSLAALIALFAGRYLWKWAVRIGARRMQRQAPTTMAELHTERDRLRAEYALISQKLGARLESVKGHMAEQMAEVSRTRNRIEAMTVELNARDAALAALQSEKDALVEKTASAEAEVTSLRKETSEQASLITRLEQRLREASGPIEIGDAPFASPPRLLDVIPSRLESYEQPAPAPSEEIPPDPLDPLAAAERETEDIQRELARLDAAWNEKLSELSASGSPAKPGTANVVSLAKRIKKLKPHIAKT
ncbi:hypothetical protein [Aestuariivirga sp.]|uniref:hypothetical protein n=1 Tax=Aestuariivirga sp. TaxID=2650926 RepID=UPI0039E21DDD